MSPMTICLEPGCPRPATSRGRCDEHRKQLERDRSARRREEGDKSRDRRVKIHHSARLVRTSRQVRAANPICQKCGARLSEVTHHVHALGDGGEAFPTGDGALIALCAACHNAISVQEQREGQGR